MTELSFEAKSIAAAWFFAMKLRTSVLRFEMVEYKPTARAQKGLDDLLAAGFISIEKNRYGGVAYRPLKDMSAIAAPVSQAFLDGKPLPGSNFQLVEPIALASEEAAQ